MSELRVLQQSQLISDTSDVELAKIATEIVKRPTRKRKCEITAGHLSSSGNSSCSSPILPLVGGSALGFLRKASDSNDDRSDVDGYAKCITVMKGYDTATTAVVTDSEDDLFFLEENCTSVDDQFSVEYEPPATDDGEDDSDDEESLILHTSDESEDPGAEGGDEFEGEDGTDSEIDEDEMWSCVSCSTKNHPMTRHCAGCWGRRYELLPTGLERSSSTPVPHGRRDNVANQLLSRSNSLCTAPTIETVNNLVGKRTCHCPICMAVYFVPSVAEKRPDAARVIRSNFVCPASSTRQNSSELASSSQKDTVPVVLPNCQHLNSTLDPTQADTQHLCNTVLSDSGISNISLGSNVETASHNAGNQSPREISAGASVENDIGINQKVSKEVYEKGPADVCIICLSQPRNASFVHGQTGHQVCCIDCAEKMKATKKKCPVCRKKIQLVVKNFL